MKQRVRRMFRSDIGKLMVPSFAVAFMGRMMQLAMTVLAARILLPEGYGIFTFAFGVGLLGGRIGALGWPMLMSRFIPRYTVDETWGLLLGFFRAAHMVVTLSSICTGALCIAVALWLGPDSHLYIGLLLGGVMLPLMSYRALYRNVLAALKLPQNGIMVDELLPAALVSACLLVLINQSIVPTTAIGIYIAASLIAVAFGARWIRRNVPAELATAEPEYRLGTWMRTAIPALVGTAAMLIMNKADILMLGPLAGMEAVGLYGAALRVTAIQTAPVAVISTVITARISEAFAAERNRHGTRVFFVALAFALLYAGSFALLVILFAEDVLTFFFGRPFAGGAAVLSILAIAQIGAAMNTLASSFMLMTGREGAFSRITFLALFVNVGLNLWLIPTMGAEGAAIATLCSIWLLCAFQLWSCLRIIRSGEFKDKPQT